MFEGVVMRQVGRRGTPTLGSLGLKASKAPSAVCLCASACVDFVPNKLTD